MGLTIQPITQAEAKAFIRRHHRHHKPPTGWLFGVAVNDGEKVVGVATVGRPVSRMLDDGLTAEVNRCCTDGTKNACSKLYATAWRPRPPSRGKRPLTEGTTMNRMRVYISGPITKGSRNHNFHQSVVAEQELMIEGFAPMNPMATMTLPFAWEEAMTHALWLERDFAWIEVSHAILRLPGYSVGADAELTYAEELGIPIFHSVEQLIQYRKESQLAA